MLTVDSAVLEF